MFADCLGCHDKGLLTILAAMKIDKTLGKPKESLKIISLRQQYSQENISES